MSLCNESAVVMGATSLLTVLFGLLTVHDRKDNPCDQAVVEIANRYSQHAVHLFPLAQNVLSSYVIQSLNMAVLNNNTPSSRQWGTDTFIVLSPDVLSVSKFLNTTTFVFRKDTPWVLGLYDAFDIDELTEVFQIFFNHGILNVVTVSLQGSNCLVHTYYPFRVDNNGDNCFNYHPSIVDEWNSFEFLRHSDMFPRNKMENMQGCPVKSMIFTIAPYVLYSKNDNRNPLQGSTVGLFTALHMKMNFTPEFSLVVDTSLGRSQLITNPVALGFGIAYSSELGYRIELSYQCASWCVPTVVKDIRGWEALTKTFAWDLWLFCIGSVLIAVVVTKVIVRFSDRESRIRKYPSWLIVCNLVLESPLPSPRQAKLRFFFLSLCIAGLVIGTVFKARLHVLMSSKPPDNKFSTLSQFYDSELNLIINTQYIWMLKTVSNESFYKNRAVFFDRSKVNLLEFALSVLNQGKNGFLCSDSYCSALAIKLGRMEEGHYKVYHVPECVVTTGRIGFGFSRESPFSEVINRITVALWESGISNKIMATDLPREVLSSRKVVIDLQDVHAIFLLWLGGLAIGFAVLVAELLTKHGKKCFS